MAPRNRLTALAHLMRLHRPIGAFLLLWPTLWALWLAADGRPAPALVVIFIAGTWVMRSAGCVINDCADRHIDRHVARTRDRPLARGDLTLGHALGLFVALLAVALLLVSQLNRPAQWLALPAVLIAMAYPFAKRVLAAPQLVLGVAFSLGIPMAYAAVRGAVPPEAWWLFAANFAWIVAYDTQYAMADREDDVRIGVKSSAILLGHYDTVAVAMLHLTCLGLLAMVGAHRALPWPFPLGLTLALGFAIYQQTLIRHRERAACERAFRNNHGFGAVIFFALLLALLPTP